MSSNLPGHHTFDTSHVVREWIVPFVCLIFAIFAARWFVVSDLNLLAAVACVIGGMGLGTAIVSPKAGLYLLLFTTGYIDYFKRFTVVMGMVDMQDIAVILSISPLIFVCVILGIIAHAIFRRLTIRPIDRKIIAFSTVIMSAGTLAIFRDTPSVQETLKAGANSVGYVPLLFVVGLVFRTPAETARFLKHAALILLPVPLYAVWQQLFGPTQVEYEYLRSGLTITAGLLDDNRFRPFSTMSSPHPLSISCATFFVLCLIPRPEKDRGFFSWLTWKWHLIALVFLIGCLASFARAGWADAFQGLVATFCFRYKLLTKLLYASAILSIVVLILSANWLENNIGEIEQYLPVDTAIGEQAFRLGTLGDRLIGWQNILNSAGILRPFGIPLEERDETVYVHDQIGGILVNFGYAGLSAIMCILAWTLIKAHSLVWRQKKNPEAFSLAVGSLSAIFGMLTSGAMFGGHTSVFPVNVYFWFLGGTLFQVLLYQEGPATTPQPVQIEPPVRAPRRRDPQAIHDQMEGSQPPLTPRRP